MQNHVEMTHAALLRGDVCQTINATFWSKRGGADTTPSFNLKKFKISYIPMKKTTTIWPGRCTCSLIFWLIRLRPGRWQISSAYPTVTMRWDLRLGGNDGDVGWAHRTHVAIIGCKSRVKELSKFASSPRYWYQNTWGLLKAFKRG